MATTLFAIDIASDLTSETTPHSDGTFSTTLEKVLSLSRGSGVASWANGTNGGSVTIANAWNWFDNVPANNMAWYTKPLNAVTIAGTITVNLRALESSTMANYGVGCKIYKRSAAGVYTLIGQGSNAVELGTAEAAKSITITPTSTALATGDRLVVVPVWLNVGGTAGVGFTATFFYNGASGATGDMFVTFTETITEVPPTYEQEDYRFRNDDGDEITATWAQPLNTGHNVALDTSARLRFVIAETAGVDPPSQNYSIYARRKPAGGSFGAYAAVLNTGAMRAVGSSFLIDQAATTQQLSAGTFVAGKVVENSGVASAVDLAPNSVTELEYVVMPLAVGGAADGDTYEFQVRIGSTALTTYTNTPTLTVGAVTPRSSVHRKRSFIPNLLR